MNMESHIEHHIYPLVPFHALPKLRQRLKGQLPQPYRSLWDGSKQLLPVLFKQKRDPNIFIKREIPPSVPL
jgi:fatty acid desaturase